MYVKILALVTLAAAFILNSCAPSNSNIVVSEFGDTKITMKEFENAYEKNAGSLEAAKKDSLNELRNFLDLYTNFKMKLRDALVRGYDKDTSLQNELQDYKNKVGVSFLLNKEIVEPAIENLYNRRKYEIRVSHIMFKPDSTGEGAAKELAAAVLDSIKKGASFEEMAKKYSQDFYSKNTGGDIYYITAGLLPPSFEDAAYATEPGHVYPYVVKTKFGYHLIKVTDKRERVPQIRASHILIRFANSAGKIDSASAKAKIDSILMQIKNGADFAEMAKKYSEDPGSKNNGGDLGFFQRRQMVKEFDEAAFNLNVGEVSGIIKTHYGYHIIKVTDKAKYPSFDEDKDNLKKILQQTSYQEKYDSLVSNLRKKYEFKTIGKTVDFIVSNSDSSKVGYDSVLSSKAKGMVIYSFTGKSKDAGDFLNELNNQKEFTGKLITLQLLNNAITKNSSEELLEKEAENLEKTDSAFAALIEDYKNGIYIFKLQTEEVWDKVGADSSELQNFYRETKQNYNWPARASFSFVSFTNNDLAKKGYDKLQTGELFDSLGAIKEENLQDTTSILARTAYDLSKPGDYSKPVDYQNSFYIVKLKEKEPAHEKTFEEAKPEVSAAYQDKKAKTLENEYVQRLKDRYKPVYHYDELTKAFKNE